MMRHFSGVAKQSALGDYRTSREVHALTLSTWIEPKRRRKSSPLQDRGPHDRSLRACLRNVTKRSVSKHKEPTVIPKKQLARNRRIFLRCSGPTSERASKRASEQASECSPLRGTIVSGCPIVKTYHPRPPKVPAGFQPTAHADRFFYLKRVYDGGKTFTRTRTYKTTPKERRKKERKNERRNPSSTELRGIAQENIRETLITFRN